MSPAARYAPMKATAGSLPVSKDWAYEVKWDGMRAIVANEATGISAHSARLNDITHRFPELADLREVFGSTDAVVDGEIVAFAPDELPNFGLLQRRMHLDRPHDIERQRVETPVAYVVFDLLRFDGNETLRLPYDDRRRLLESLVDKGPTWQVATTHYDGGQDLLSAVAQRGMEGLVAKRRDSPYRPGKRSRDWVKVKVRRRQELVVGGLLSGDGQRSDTIGALLVGYYDDEGLRYAGRVGSGLSTAVGSRLLELARPLAVDESRFLDPVPSVSGRSITFLEPTLVVEIEFGEWTREDNLRHPVFAGLRDDVEPTEVIREPDPAIPPES